MFQKWAFVVVNTSAILFSPQLVKKRKSWFAPLFSSHAVVLNMLKCYGKIDSSYSFSITDLLWNLFKQQAQYCALTFSNKSLGFKVDAHGESIHTFVGMNT